MNNLPHFSLVGKLSHPSNDGFAKSSPVGKPTKLRVPIKRRPIKPTRPTRPARFALDIGKMISLELTLAAHGIKMDGAE